MAQNCSKVSFTFVSPEFAEALREFSDTPIEDVEEFGYFSVGDFEEGTFIEVMDGEVVRLDKFELNRCMDTRLFAPKSQSEIPGFFESMAKCGMIGDDVVGACFDAIQGLGSDVASAKVECQDVIFGEGVECFTACLVIEGGVESFHESTEENELFKSFCAAE